MKTTIITLLSLIGISASYSQDWANLDRYKQANKELPAKTGKRVVFIGNSITDGWATQRPAFFSKNNYVGRGIGGQTTPQMLIRFKQDVINIGADKVVILAGINDIAGNTGYSTLEMIMNNISSMCEIATANNVVPIICSVLPVSKLPWKPEVRSDLLVPELNVMLKNYAAQHKIQYIDYYSKMVNDQNGLPKELAQDGVHPTAKGYEIMEAIIATELK